MFIKNMYYISRQASRQTDGRAGRQAELRICVKVEVADLSSPSLISPVFFMDVKHREIRKEKRRRN